MHVLLTNMAANLTYTEDNTPITKKDSSIAIAIILPALFAIVVILLVAIAFLIPRLHADETPASKEERRKNRLARLDSSVKAQHFVDWAATQRIEHPDVEVEAGVHALWCVAPGPQGLFTSIRLLIVRWRSVICLEEFSSASQIRGLGCLHVFHQECLDDWFGRWNEYCPLCHRPIIQGLADPKKRGRDRARQPSVAFLV